jgi:transposase
VVLFGEDAEMARARLVLAGHLTAAALRARYRGCRDAKEGRRWHALWLVAEGRSAAEAAALVGLDPSRVRQIVRRYNADGPASVADGHRANPGGPAPRLTAAQQDALRAALADDPPGGGLWTGAKVAAWMDATLGSEAPTWPQLGWVYLRRLGHSPQVPRPRHARAASPDEQRAWQKN